MVKYFGVTMRELFLMFMMFLAVKAHADVGFYIADSSEPHKSYEIDSILNNFIENNPDRDILFYVHGRSRTLEKEWNNINKIEEIYNVKVLMLHWDSWSNAVDRPVENTVIASGYLLQAMNYINSYKNRNKAKFQNRKLLMMCHSMGNIILKNYMENYFSSSFLSTNLFDSLVLNGSDTPFTGHKKWVEKIKFSQDIIITMNKNDSVLLASRVLDYTQLNLADDRLGLGLGIDNYLFFNTSLAQNAKYYDFTAISGMEHRHYLSSNPDVINMFKMFYKEKELKIEIPFKQKKNVIKFR